MTENRGSNGNGAGPSREQNRASDRAQMPVRASKFYGKNPDSSAGLLRANNGEGSSHTTYVAPGGPSSSTLAPAAGSSHTKYIPPDSKPPAYDQNAGSWREPELVSDDDKLPDLIDNAVTSGGWPNTGTPYGDTYPQTWGNENFSPWPESGTSAIEVSSFGPPIDGRNEDTEKDWWDKTKRELGVHPGPGMLPPLMTDRLHNSEHTLFMVHVTPPDFKSTEPAAGSSAATTTPSSPTRASTQVPNFNPPTNEEVLQAVPHPHAYFCRKHNAWVLLQWKSSSVLPRLTEAFEKSNHHPFPSAERRKRTHSCVTNDTNANAHKANVTHHFHCYEKAVDARQLNPGFSRKAWEKTDKVKTRHRKMTITVTEDELDDIIANKVDQPELLSSSNDSAQAEVDLLDLYVCCQCSFYAVVSDVIPGVIPCKYMEEITNDKFQHPTLGKTGEETVVAAWDTILTIIENNLWKGNERGLSIGGKTFTTRLGWQPVMQRVLIDSLGFTLQPNPDPNAPPILTPPKTDDSAQGKISRERLLRAWVEIGAYVAEYMRRFPKGQEAIRGKWVKVESAREMYQDAMGAHPSQLARGGLPPSLETSPPPPKEPWEILGMTSSSYDPALLHFAYLAQCRCDPEHTIQYFTALRDIVEMFKAVGSCPEDLQNLLVAEESRGRFTLQQLENATRLLGFGKDNKLQMDFDDDVEDEFILNAWKDATRRSWLDTEGAALRRELNEACRQIGEVRGSATLLKTLQDEISSAMTPDKAFSTLEVPHDVEDEMLLTVYSMRVEEQPMQLENMRRALKVIAECRNSDRLLQFLETGTDPGIIVASVQPDWPRGLNQLGNTCYLNSLLQYFYTIRELREAVAPLASATSKFTDDDKLKDDDLKKHRVGGRLVTRREVIRSRKFVSQLATLFHQLEWSGDPAVTPSLELAKLALVTSKDEEDDDYERSGTETSTSTDATLVDEPTPMVEAPRRQSKSASPPVQSPSVLGKRPRVERKLSEARSDISIETIDEPTRDKEGFVLVSKASGSPQGASSAQASNENTPDGDGDVEMQDASQTGPDPSKAPPLPPRPKAPAHTSEMLFGKQHDVAECMDNCMFQIETALLEFGELEVSDPQKTSIVKRLFYGKLKQRLRPQVTQMDPSAARTSLHEREDVFSHLPVNVTHDSFDLYDGLSGYFDDVVEYEGKKARMEVTLVDLPPILQIQLQRVQFDRETVQAYKSHTYVKFGETICMDRFLDDAPSSKRTRSKVLQRELNGCRERIHALSRGTYAPYGAAITNTLKFLEKQEGVSLPEADEELLASLKEESTGVDEEIEKCRARSTQLKVQLEELWADQNRAEYDLTAVFIHRGASPSFGHYFIYQRWLPHNLDKWIKYNDSDVTLVSKEEVLADTTGSTANPYLLVFTRRDASIVDTIQRSEEAVAMETQ